MAHLPQQALLQAKQLTEQGTHLSPANVHAIPIGLLARVEVHPTRVELHLVTSHVPQLLLDTAQGD